MQHPHPNPPAWGHEVVAGTQRKATKRALDSGGLLTVRTLRTSGIPLGTI